MEAYLRLESYPEVRQALTALSGYSLAILSNGSPRMLRAAVTSAGLQGTFSRVISVDSAKIFKPSPRVYGLAPQKLRVAKAAIGFVSSNFWDVAGAKAFGFRTFWVNRSSARADELGLIPDATVNSLTDLVELINT
jgi:2-haloacid dehalogenase